jgi:hypothetical protein
MKHDFISIADFSPDEIQHLLDLAIKLKQEHFSGGNKPVLKGHDLPKTQPAHSGELRYGDAPCGGRCTLFISQ